MEKSPNKKIALVTGANKGIGLEVARQLAKRGFHVVLTARKKSQGEKAAASIGEAASFIEMDVSKRDSIQKAAQEFKKHFDHLDVLVNNAGILLDDSDPILKTKPETMIETFTTNTLGPLMVAQAFAPFLEKSSSPRIVNVSSGEGALNSMGSYAPAYSISKAALNAVTRQLSAGLRSKNISVNSGCPGWVRTDMGGSSAPRSVEEGADNIVWLATDAPQKLTGEFLEDRERVSW